MSENEKFVKDFLKNRNIPRKQKREQERALLALLDKNLSPSASLSDIFSGPLFDDFCNLLQSHRPNYDIRALFEESRIKTMMEDFARGLRFFIMKAPSMITDNDDNDINQVIEKYNAKPDKASIDLYLEKSDFILCQIALCKDCSMLQGWMLKLAEVFEKLLGVDMVDRPSFFLKLIDNIIDGNDTPKMLHALACDIKRALNNDWAQHPIYGNFAV